MKVLSILALTLFSFAMPQMTARDYYKELRDAGGLNRFKDEYVCFSDEEDGSFTTVAKVPDIIAQMKEVGDDKGVQTMDSVKTSLLFSFYKKGVEGTDQILEPDYSNYAMTFDTPFNGKMRYSINWVTGRYRLQIYDLKKSATNTLLDETGKCELIHPDRAVTAAKQ